MANLEEANQDSESTGSQCIAIRTLINVPVALPEATAAVADSSLDSSAVHFDRT